LGYMVPLDKKEVV